MDPGRDSSSFDATIARFRETFTAKASAVVGFPRATILPNFGEPDSAGKRAWQALRAKRAAQEGETEQEASASTASGRVRVEAQRVHAGIQLELGDTIGEGGMGRVRAASQRSMGRPVAVKILREECADEGNAMRLLREAWVTGALEHPNVLPVYDVSVDETGMPMVVMRRIEGVDWADIIHDSEEMIERFGEGDRLEHNLRIFAQLCQVVAFAHSRGIVHRDIKPENVRIGLFGELYLLDWGIALALEDDGSGRFPLASEAREMAGTPGYMAPEMLGGDMPPITKRTDLYLLGAVLYEIVCGGAPHDGDNMMAVISKIVCSAPDIGNDVPEILTQAISACMAPDPEMRTMTVEQLRERVQEYLRERAQKQIFADAQDKLRELREMLTDAQAAADKRGSVYTLLGACRFGFRNVLEGGGSREAANKELNRALESVARFELAEGDARAAQTLCDEMIEPPAAFRDAVAKALAEQLQREERAAQLAHDVDKSVGQRTRAFVGVVVGVATTVLPLLATAGPNVEVSYKRLLFVTVAALFGFGAVGAWARESLSKTRYNRRSATMMLALLVLQLVALVGGFMIGIDAQHLLILFPFLWGFAATAAVVAIEWRMWPSALAYLIAFLIGSGHQAWIYYAMAAANFVLTCNVVVIWYDPVREALPRRSQERT